LKEMKRSKESCLNNAPFVATYMPQKTLINYLFLLSLL
jgi:hypothetical protein